MNKRVDDDGYIRFGNSANGWTAKQVAEIEAKFGKGFLERNSHYPAVGEYQNEDGSTSYPQPLSLEGQRALKVRHDG